MRVLYVNHSCVLRVNQQRVAELARNTDLEVSVLCPRRWRDRDTGEEFAFEQPAEARFVACPLPAYLAFHPILYLYAPGVVRRVMDTLRPDIVHIEQEPYSACAFQMARLARACGARVVITASQNLDKRYPQPFRAMERFTLRAADHVAGVTEDTTALWSGRAGNGKAASTIPQGYDPTLFFPRDGTALRRRLGLRGFVIGYLGRLIEPKGLAILLEAAARLDRDFTLLIVGRGPYREALVQRARALGLADRLVFVHPAHDEVPEVVCAMEVLVLPSYTTPQWKEQFGRALVEAMACGVPVVGSTSGSIPWVMGDAGLLFPERDSNALADRLARLMKDRELREELRARGLRRAGTVFTWASVAKQMREVYRQVLGAA